MGDIANLAALKILLETGLTIDDTFDGVDVSLIVDGCKYSVKTSYVMNAGGAIVNTLCIIKSTDRKVVKTGMLGEGR